MLLSKVKMGALILLLSAMSPMAHSYMQPTATPHTSLTTTHPNHPQWETIYCEEVEQVPDDGFVIYLTQTGSSPDDFTMNIERSLLTGPQNETLAVVKVVSGQVGSPVEYMTHDKSVILSIQMTATPRPDHKYPAGFTKVEHGYTETRELLCERKH